MSKDPYYYNVTLSVSDQGGLNSLSSVNVYLNITKQFSLKDSIFECSIVGVKSELNNTDGISLVPPLFIQV